MICEFYIGAMTYIVQKNSCLRIILLKVCCMQVASEVMQHNFFYCNLLYNSPKIHVG